MLVSELCVNVQVSNTVRSSTPFLFPYRFVGNNSSISQPSKIQRRAGLGTSHKNEPSDHEKEFQRSEQHKPVGKAV